MSEISGRTALVTGAAKRIGREIALALARAQVHCLLHYHRSAHDVAETAEECRRFGTRAEAVQADFRELAEIEALGRSASERHVDILVHNASTFSRVPFLETPLETHRQLLERDLSLHVATPYLLGRALGESMVARGWGRIVLIGDWSTEVSVFRHYAPYIVSKAAIPALTKVLALELGTRSPAVTANAVLPGPILPGEGHDPDDVAMVKRQTITGRWLGPEAIARSVVFLAENAEITGEALRVDGGRSMKAL